MRDGEEIEKRMEKIYIEGREREREGVVMVEIYKMVLLKYYQGASFDFSCSCYQKY